VKPPTPRDRALFSNHGVYAEGARDDEDATGRRTKNVILIYII